MTTVLNLKRYLQIVPALFQFAYILFFFYYFLKCHQMVKTAQWLFLPQFFLFNMNKAEFICLSVQASAYLLFLRHL